VGVVEVVRVQEALMHVTPIWTQFCRARAVGVLTKIISMYVQPMHANLYTNIAISAYSGEITLETS
jgi:hypothetical protein